MAAANRRCNHCHMSYLPDLRISGQSWFCSRACLYADQKVPLEALYQRDGGICHLCKLHVPWRQASKDHLVPRKDGGRTTWANVALAHKACNNRRGSKALADARLRVPAMPRMMPSRRMPINGSR